MTMRRIDFDAVRFYREHGVQYATEGNKHCQPGWVQIHCPFCTGSRDYHLGFNLQERFFSCWRCGWKSVERVVAAILRCSQGEARAIARSCVTRAARREIRASRRRAQAQELTLPSGTMSLLDPMARPHRKYLRERGYDPEYLDSVWKVAATGPVGDYRFRVVAPIYHQQELVSFQARDITGQSDLRYKACPKEREVVDHHDVLYGLDLVRNDTCVVVEGITDAWRLGPGAVAVFGIKFRPPQVALLSRMRRVFILFDHEPDQAQVQARKLGSTLATLGADVELLTLDSGDPAELSQDEADALMRELSLRK